MLERQPRARADLDLVPRRDGDGEAGGDGMALARPQGDVLGGDHVHPRRAMAGVARQRQPFAMRQPGQGNADHFFFLRAGFFDGPFAALASIRATASSNVTAFGSAVFGKVACVVPSVA